MAGTTARVSIDHGAIPTLPDYRYYKMFPGEHYVLLAAICRVFKPLNVVEIGTFTGMSSRVFVDFCPPLASLVTVDIVAWRNFRTPLSEADFAGNRPTQEVVDLSEENAFRSFADGLQSADLIFRDGPKDGRFEQKFLDRLMQLTFKTTAVLILDDIRLQNMIVPRASIDRPKLDISGFGHWSGTGVVELG